MDRVAAEVTQEVCVFFEDYDQHSCSREQEPQHCACRPAADYAAADLVGNRHTMCISGSRGIISAHSTYTSNVEVNDVARAEQDRVLAGVGLPRLGLAR